MHLSRGEKERIVVVAVAIVVVIALFFGGRALLRVLSDRPERPVTVETPAPAPAPDEPPVVTFVDGEADGRLGSSDRWEPLDAGFALDRRSVVRTYENSYLDIRLQTGSVIRVMEETLFSLSELTTERIDMDIREGEVVSRLERLAGTQEFSIRTPAAVAGVRGTELVLSVASDETTVFGMSGSVEVSNPEFPDDITVLGAHTKAAVTGGAPPTEPMEMTAQEISRYQRLLDSLNEEEVLIVSTAITFQPDSAELAADARDALRDIYEQLREVERNIEIVGHTANIGSPQSQLTLSRERAETVRTYLVELGMSETQLSATGVGGTRAITESTDPEAMRRNRRVEFRAK